ncbi:MAG: aminopeptidase P N-terminal domain-containing protein [Cyclobacteriaceae bacterium]|nr:aminopeptidase P N-terminal domain-containing protein [Cyclobacteriaceae bacterium]
MKVKYEAIDQALFIDNRKKLMSKMAPASIAIFHSNDIMPTSADGTMPFVQDADLFYLTGIDQEESILVLCPEFPNEKMREILFLKKTSKHIAIWEGHKYTKDEARETSGVQTIMWVESFEQSLNTLMAECQQVYLNSNEHIRAVVEVETRNARFVKWCQQHYPLHQYLKVAPVMHELRAIKSNLEVAQLQTACDITEAGFRRILSFVEPGVTEYEIEAEYLHEFIRRRSHGFAYEPIIASGASACVLHYVENRKECKDGDVLLMDVGANYANYNADMTRSIPVNGRYTDRQKAVYNAVLRVMRQAMKLLTPGNSIPEYHQQVGEIMEGELVDLGLLKTEDIKNQDPEIPAYKKFFMHGTSHHLGLNVHDVANIYRKFEPGMVFTVEPGIYIPEENLGIRIENNVVIRENGLDDLMANIPLEAEEIEDLMNA